MSPSSRPRDAKVMVSNLPLLFAKSDPTSLEMMSLEELQVFLRFMIKCEQNLTEVNIDNLPRPEWWPDNVTYDEKLLAQKEQRGRHSVLLRGVIRSCYTYHNCMYLLEFCRKLITFTGGVENLQVLDNDDGTRSLLNKVNKKLLVTFRAENQDYDKDYYSSKDVLCLTKNLSVSFHTKSPLKPIDSKRLGTVNTTNASDPALSKCVDVYLCDTCDKDFDSLEDLIEHEKRCGKQKEQALVPSSRFPNRDKATADKFFSSLKIARKTGKGTIVFQKKSKLKESDRPRATSYKQFMDIMISSLLGRYIFSSSNCLYLDTQQAQAARGYKNAEDYRMAFEAYCGGSKTTIKNQEQISTNSKYKWPSIRSSRKKENSWSHSYCFNNAQKVLRMREILAGMTLPALRLWRKYNKPHKQPKLTLKRLNRHTVEAVKKRVEEERKEDRELEEKRVREAEELKEKRRNRGVELGINFEAGVSGADMDIIPLFPPSVSLLTSPRSQPSSSSHRSFSHSPPYTSPRINQSHGPIGSVPWTKSSFFCE